MSYDTHYGGYIWTKHALERLDQRGLTQSQVFDTIKNPTRSGYGSKKGTFRYVKIKGSEMIEAVVTRSAEGPWLVLTCWSGPANKFRPTRSLWEKFLRYLWRKLWGKSKSNSGKNDN